MHSLRMSGNLSLIADFKTRYSCTYEEQFSTVTSITEMSTLGKIAQLPAGKSILGKDAVNGPSNCH